MWREGGRGKRGKGEARHNHASNTSRQQLRAEFWPTKLQSNTTAVPHKREERAKRIEVRGEIGRGERREERAESRQETRERRGGWGGWGVLAVAKENYNSTLRMSGIK